MLQGSTSTMIQNDLSTLALERITAARPSLKSQKPLIICCKSERLCLGPVPPSQKDLVLILTLQPLCLRGVASPLRDGRHLAHQLIVLRGLIPIAPARVSYAPGFEMTISVSRTLLKGWPDVFGRVQGSPLPFPSLFPIYIYSIHRTRAPTCRLFNKVVILRSSSSGIERAAVCAQNMAIRSLLRRSLIIAVGM